MRKKVLMIFIFVLIVSILGSHIYAASLNITEIFNRAKWTSSASPDAWGRSLGTLVREMGTKIIAPIGYLVFAIVTVVLGVKYIWNGYEGKSKVKETLPGYICAVVFFYLATEITDFIFNFGNANIKDKDFTTMTGNIWVNVCNVIQLLAFGGIMFIGIRYLFESPSGKAKIKERLVPMVIGMVFVFCAAEVVEAITTIGDAVI